MGNHPHHNSHGWGEGPAIRRGNVATDTLDNITYNFVPAQDCIAVMKIDIEGFEFFAMQGFNETLRTRPPCNIFMEYHTILLKAASSASRSDASPLKLVHLLQDAGYTSSQQVPQDPAADAEMNLHWRLFKPPTDSKCDCSDMLRETEAQAVR